jgi:hypothetical protein
MVLAMNVRPRISVTLLPFLAAVLAAPNVWAKRAAPMDVAPVVVGDVRYEAPHFSNPCDQNGGCVVAYDNTSNAMLWFVQVYCTHYDPNLEQDAQDVFITALAVDSAKLLVTNESGRHFALDLASRQVTGDPTGCTSAAGTACAVARAGQLPQRGSFVMVIAAAGLATLLARSRRFRA